MRKVLLIAITVMVLSCNTRTRTITDHAITLADSTKIIYMKITVLKIAVSSDLINRMGAKIRSGKLDSVALNRAVDSINLGANTILSGAISLKDTTYN